MDKYKTLCNPPSVLTDTGLGKTSFPPKLAAKGWQPRTVVQWLEHYPVTVEVASSGSISLVEYSDRGSPLMSTLKLVGGNRWLEILFRASSGSCAIRKEKFADTSIFNANSLT